MNIALSPATQRMLEEKLQSGQYGSPDDVVRAALEALNELSTLCPDEEILDGIDRAEDQIESGNVHDWKNVRDQVRSKFLGN